MEQPRLARRQRYSFIRRFRAKSSDMWSTRSLNFFNNDRQLAFACGTSPLRMFRYSKGRYRSGQTGQTVNLLALRLRWFESSPAQSLLQELFSQAGAVQEVTLMQDRFTGKSRGFAFITMGSDEDAQNAISKLNGQAMEGRPLTVNEARPREPRAPGGGGGRGYGGGGGYGGRREGGQRRGH